MCQHLENEINGIVVNLIMKPVWIPMDCCMLKVTVLKNWVKKSKTTRFTPVWGLYKQWCWKKYLETTRCANLIICQSKTYPDWPRRILDVIQNVLQHDRLKIFTSTPLLDVSLETHRCKELEEHGDWDKKKWNQEPGSSKPPSSPGIKNKIITPFLTN